MLCRLCLFHTLEIGHFVIVLYATKCDGECFHMIPLGENYFHFGLSTHSIIDLAALAQNARFRLLSARVVELNENDNLLFFFNALYYIFLFVKIKS